MILVTLICLIRLISAFENGLGKKPQMGWNSWNKFGCDINETVILGTAQKMKELGLLDYGYEYIVMDDCYALKERDPTTHKLLADPGKFPNGIRNLSNQIHRLGFKFGMYSSAGRYTCAGYPGSLHYEQIDAETFAHDWEIDYLKYDNCFNEGNSGTPQISYQRYDVMSKALINTGRPIFYSLCQWGEDQVWDWGSTLANSWRISGDIYDNFDRYDDRCPCETYNCPAMQGQMCSMTNILEKAIPLGQRASKFLGWNDLDSLEVGNGGMSTDEYKAHFTLWAILKSPLVLGNDVAHMSKEDLAIVTNRAIIAINQDDSVPASRVWKKTVDGGFLHLFTNTMGDGSFVVTLFNSGDTVNNTVLLFSDIFVDDRTNAAKSYNFTELWSNETITATEMLTTSIQSHSVKIWWLDCPTKYFDGGTSMYPLHDEL
ncbi:uncharacterized protein PRCAT00004788001 [Priceomyces carsonii]|uniref:uncharacterized protein n=1 Tax=Priceomyces carsonii TaxID=28549 RepID=UPI002EDAAC17|nr:unnamed protein product [Priceomyces carsonii]